MRRREFIAGLSTIAAWLGAQAWGLSLALFTLVGLLSGAAYACSNPINPTLSRSIINTARFLREFIVSGCADDVPPDGLPIVFGFHGGGERLHDESGSGFLDFTDLSALHALVIVPVGNVSNNGHSWINAFPWMKPHPENDLLLPAALIDWIALQPDLPRADRRRVYALGKSDGAGMSNGASGIVQMGRHPKPFTIGDIAGSSNTSSAAARSLSECLLWETTAGVAFT
jgi:hypothetical protein